MPAFALLSRGRGAAGEAGTGIGAAWVGAAAAPPFPSVAVLGVLVVTGGGDRKIRF